MGTLRTNSLRFASDKARHNVLPLALYSLSWTSLIARSTVIVCEGDKCKPFVLIAILVFMTLPRRSLPMACAPLLLGIATLLLALLVLPRETGMWDVPGQHWWWHPVVCGTFQVWLILK